jgi:hypothetical protein
MMTLACCTAVLMLCQQLATADAMTAPVRSWSARPIGAQRDPATNGSFAISTLGDKVVAGPPILMASTRVEMHTSPDGAFTVMVDPHARSSFVLVDADAMDPLARVDSPATTCTCSYSDGYKCATAVATCVGTCVGTWGAGCFTCLSAFPNCCMCVGYAIGDCSYC